MRVEQSKSSYEAGGQDFTLVLRVEPEFSLSGDKSFPLVLLLVFSVASESSGQVLSSVVAAGRLQCRVQSNMSSISVTQSEVQSSTDCLRVTLWLLGTYSVLALGTMV